MDTVVTSASRRSFLKASAAIGGGLAIEFTLPANSLAQSRGVAAGQEVTAWLLIYPDERVVVRIARSEMGQGSFTGLPMLVAEELQCDWKNVSAEYASTTEQMKRNRVWGSMSTGGSSSIRTSHEILRRAGATARTMLINAAAQQWNVAASECVAENGVITHAASRRSTSFGKVADAAARLDAPKDVKLKDPKDWKLLGTARKRFDIPDKVTGKQVYGIDVTLPGMLHASVMQSPVFGGKVRSVDSAATEKMRGVKQIVRLENAVAVVADNWWRANQALKTVKVEWDEVGNSNVSSDSIMALLSAGLDDPAIPNAKKTGDAAAALSGAARVMEAEYFTPYLNHATMEPQNCTAWVKGDKVEVWAPTQNAEGTVTEAAKALGVPEINVEFHKMHLGGGFGRRGVVQDFVKLAVLVARQVNARLDVPVKLTWSREEDIKQGAYRPVSLYRMKAGLDAAGNVTAWHSRIAAPSIMLSFQPDRVRNGIDTNALGGFIDMPYTVPNTQVDYSLKQPHVPVTFWRAVAHSQNPFARECFIDEMAHATNKDPVEFRRAMLKAGDRNLLVMEAAARAAGWSSPLPAGVHRGIAVQDSYGSYAAAVIELSVSDAGEIDVKRVVVAVDSGYVVNPDSAKAQIESNVVYGLTAALLGEITIKNGRVEQSNFYDYQMLRINRIPKVESVLVPTGGTTWGGFGEPPLSPLAPALCNALFAATGKRIRSLPVKNHDLKQA
jgi:isoquinoline 1-oxidoreductase beta subunit